MAHHSSTFLIHRASCANFPVQQRHKPAFTLVRHREIIIACAPLKSNANASAIARAAGCAGASKLILCGNAKLHEHIARESASSLHIQIHRSLEPVLRVLKDDGYHIVGLEQTSKSISLYNFAFPRRVVLVIGNEARGVSAEALALCHSLVEIPVYGMPHSHNAAVAAAIAMYEYCRQYPTG